MQTQTAIDPSLAALLQTAQMVTPEQTPTVAAQVAQAAQQKMQPQGIMQNMQGAKQDYAAAAPSMMRNMQQAQVQQMMQQAMQPKPAGIEGLPAQNMQGMQRMAGGGVVGYDGTNESYVVPRTYGYAPDYEDARRMGINLSPYDSPEDRQQKLERLKKMREFEEQRQSFGEIPTEASVAREAALQAAYPGKNRDQDVIRQVQPGRTAAPPMAASPEGQRLAQNINAPTAFDLRQTINPEFLQRLRVQAERVGGKEREDLLQKISELQAAQPSQPASAPTGIAAALAERPQYDVASIPAAGAPYMKAGEEDVGRMRKAEGERAAFERTLPDLSAKGIEALRQRMADVEAAEAQRKKNVPLDQSIAWLLGGKEGVGGSARAAQRFEATQNAAADAFSQARLQNQQAQLLLEKAQQDRQLGRFDRAIALEREASALMEKARDNALKAQQIQQGIASSQFQGAVQMRGQDITAQTAAADRAAQAALRNMPASEQQMAQKVMDDFMAKNPGATLSDAYDFYRGAGKPTDRSVLTYAQAAKIVDERLSELGTQFALNKEEVDAAKRENRTPRTLAQMREDLIRKEMAMAGRATGSAVPAPAQLPAAAASQLKAGVVTTFANGQQWTLENGQPKQVK